ncbi:MAG: oxidoreductase, partial [Bacteroidales bacterium]|nr:oxidoreductase [Bacteroidales bacterium]
GNVMVTSGNNKKKTEYISKAINAGIHVLADKPMVINAVDFELLKETFISAEEKGVLLYDIMTERYSITSILQKELSKITDVFGELLVGSPENPSITKESVHHFFKYVAGNKIKRPPWFFDVTQQGEGLVDITTHLVDLIQWECFPEVILDYQKDIEVLAAKRWPTELTPSQFESVTRLTEYPEYLKKDIVNDSVLNVYCNGEIIYKLRGIHAKVSVIWNYRAPEGGGDTHFSIMRGTKANLVIRQGEEQNYTPELYVEPVKEVENREFNQKLALAVEKLQEKYPGIEFLKLEGKWQIIIPSEYRIGHEAHFGQVTQTFLQYLVDGKLPDWEVPNMIAKYYTTTRALELAKKE